MSFVRPLFPCSRPGLTAAVAVASLSAFPAGLLAAQANGTGINVDYLYDSDNTPLLADVMRTYRFANAIGSSYNAGNASLDANGWLAGDGWYFLNDPAAQKHGDGTYAVQFNGQATINVGNLTNGGGTVAGQSYDPLTNTTTATIKTRTGVDLSQVYFTKTVRDAASSVGSGITNLQIMRPTTPGGSTPYAVGTTFTDQTKAIAGKVGVLRFMDYLATNNNTQANWSDRVTPTQVKLDPVAASSSRGKGGPLELAVQLGNEANKDIWINVPAMATDDYVTKLAQLIKYGSDGVNPYTDVQKNPVYKPLNPNLHVYLEYSNETWNNSFKQYTQANALGSAERAAELANGGNGPITYTAANGTSYDTTQAVYLGQRYTALRTKQIADLFAGVYGPSALLTAVRPILAWQSGNGNDSVNQEQIVLDGYYNNTKGAVRNADGTYAAGVSANKYIYGGGSSYYYSPTSGNTNATVDSLITEPLNQTSARVAQLAKDACYATTFGLKRVAYEGGLSYDNGTEVGNSLAYKAQALADPRMETMVVANHNQWTNEGGDLLVYYFSTDQYKFAFSDENFSTTTPKLNALTDLQNGVRSTAYSIGTAVTNAGVTTISGGRFTLKDTAGTPFDGAVSLAAGNWTSYLVNCQGGQYTLTLDYETFGARAGIQVFLGGALLADFNALALSDSKYAATPGLNVTLPQGVTSLRVLIDLGSGNASLKDVVLTPLATVPLPEPAALGVLLAGGGLLGRRRGCRA